MSLLSLLYRRRLLASEDATNTLSVKAAEIGVTGVVVTLPTSITLPVKAAEIGVTGVIVSIPTIQPIHASSIGVTGVAAQLPIILSVKAASVGTTGVQATVGNSLIQAIATAEVGVAGQPTTAQRLADILVSEIGVSGVAVQPAIGLNVLPSLVGVEGQLVTLPSLLVVHAASIGVAGPKLATLLPIHTAEIGVDGVIANPFSGNLLEIHAGSIGVAGAPIYTEDAVQSGGDFILFYSGGASNTDPDASLGGIISSTDIASQGVTQPSVMTGVTVLDAYGNPFGAGTLTKYAGTPVLFAWKPFGGLESAKVEALTAGNYTVGSTDDGQVYISHDGTSAGVREEDAITISPYRNTTYDDITYTEAIAGDKEYRCFYLQNTTGAKMYDVRVHIDEQPSGADVLSLGVDPAGVGNGVTNGVAVTIAGEGNDPYGIVFETSTEANPLIVGDVGGQGTQAIWMKRVVPPGTTTLALFDASKLVISAYR